MLPVVVVPFVPLPAVHPRQLPRSVVRGQRGPAVTPVYPFTTGFRPGELPPPDRVGRPVIMTFPPGEIPPPDRVSPPPR